MTSRSLCDKLSHMSIDALKRYRANVISEYQYYGDRQRDLEVKRAAYIKMMDAKIEECTTSMVELGKVIDTIDEFLNDEHPVEAEIEWPIPDDEVPF